MSFKGVGRELKRSWKEVEEKASMFKMKLKLQNMVVDEKRMTQKVYVVDLESCQRSKVRLHVVKEIWDEVMQGCATVTMTVKKQRSTDAVTTSVDVYLCQGMVIGVSPDGVLLSCAGLLLLLYDLAPESPMRKLRDGDWCVCEFKACTT